MKKYILSLLLVIPFLINGQNLPISGLPSASALTGTEVTIVVQGGVTKKISANNLFTGPTLTNPKFISGTPSIGQLPVATSTLGAWSWSNAPVSSTPTFSQVLAAGSSCNGANIQWTGSTGGAGGITVQEIISPVVGSNQWNINKISTSENARLFSSYNNINQQINITSSQNSGTFLNQTQTTYSVGGQASTFPGIQYYAHYYNNYNGLSIPDKHYVDSVASNGVTAPAGYIPFGTGTGLTSSAQFSIAFSATSPVLQVGNTYNSSDNSSIQLGNAGLYGTISGEQSDLLFFHPTIMRFSDVSTFEHTFSPNGLWLGSYTGSVPISATARLDIQAGTSSLGQIRLRNGTALTTTVAGMCEYAGNKWLFTNSTGRYQSVYTSSATALTSGRVPFVTTNGILTDAANFTFSGTALTVPAITISNGSETVYSGSLSQVGAATTVFTVPIGVTQANTSYKVTVTPTNLLSAAAFYVTNKTTTTFDVTYVAGLTGTVAFDYILAP